MKVLEEHWFVFNQKRIFAFLNWKFLQENFLVWLVKLESNFGFWIFEILHGIII